MPQNFTISDVQTIVRRKLNLTKEKGMFLMVNEGKNLLTSNSKLSTAFKKHKDEDGFLYILYTSDDIYGWAEKELFDCNTNLMRTNMNIKLKFDK